VAMVLPRRISGSIQHPVIEFYRSWATKGMDPCMNKGSCSKWATCHNVDGVTSLLVSRGSVERGVMVMVEVH